MLNQPETTRTNKYIIFNALRVRTRRANDVACRFGYAENGRPLRHSTNE